MVLLKKLKKFWYKKAVQEIKSSCPLAIQKISEGKAVKVFHRASQNLPFYKDYISQQGLSSHTVKDLPTFKKFVPIVDKSTIFRQDKDTVSVFPKTDIHRIQSLLLSSGSSGSFSFGINTAQETQSNTRFLGVLLDYYFNILEEKTLIINCLSQAVKLPTIEAVVVEVGPRADSLIYLLKRLAPQFSQTIIIGDNYFLKNALEDGRHANIDYSKLKIRLILGGVYLTENLRTHLSKILQMDPKEIPTSIISSMGISEFGLNLFFESKETISLRKMVKETPELQKKLFNAGLPPYIPMFFNYFPQMFFLEEKNQEIVITNLNWDAKLPLIRYNTQDTGVCIPYNTLKAILSDYNAENLLPPFKSSLVLMYGKNESILYKGQRIYPQQIQRGIYSDMVTASSTTGYFRLKETGDQIKLEIQLKKDISLSPELKAKFQDRALKFTGLDIPVELYTYREFPYGMELDYERKFKYI